MSRGPDKARFLSGSTMRHVVVMTLTSSLGLVFMFLVDAATLFWVSQLGVERHVAAVGFAWTVQFFTISVGIGLAIAATAQVARSIGEGQEERSREQTSMATLYMGLLLLSVSITVVVFRDPILRFAGAEGETLTEASQFLLISVPSLPLMALAMIGASVLRAMGDALRSMWVTMSAGLVAMVLDPFLIFTLQLGYEGAAWGVLISRATSGLIGVWFLWRIYDQFGPLRLRDIGPMARPFFAIALPAMATQLSTPFGNFLVNKAISSYGDSAVAGFAIVSRLGVLAFGGLFALSGAIGGIIGQNYGAQQLARVRSTYWDALIFSGVYTLTSWAVLILSRGFIVAAFDVSGPALEVLDTFIFVTAGSFVFAGILFTTNAAFNNLDRPIYSTVLNWTRDGVLTYPLALVFGWVFGVSGVLYGSGVAVVIAGLIAGLWCWRYMARLDANP